MKKIFYLILSVALVLSLCITASASSDASKATLVGDSSVIVGSNIELILDVSSCGDATSIAVAVTFSEDLEFVSGEWLIKGSLAYYDTDKNLGAVGPLSTPNVNGNVFKLVLKGKNASKDSQDVTINVIAKNGETEIMNYEVSKSVSINCKTHSYANDTDTQCDVCSFIRQLSGISINTKPDKLIYLEGDTFSKTGMVVTAYYNNNTSAVITNYTVSGYSSTPGSKTITVTYSGKTATFTVEVVAKSLTSIAVTTKPNKLTYLEGDTFDKTGMVVTAYYNNNTFAVVTDYTISGYTSTPGSKTVTVSHLGKTDSFIVVVDAKTLTSIAVTTKPGKLTYLEGDTFDKSGMVVTAYYNNDTSSVITDYTVSGYNSTPGTKTISVTYEGKTATFTVAVNAKPVPSGWFKENDKWYFYENGVMVKNAWRKDSKGWVKLGADGAMLINQWTKDSKGWCYVGANGYAVTNCWKKDSKGWIYLDSNGSMTKSKWVKDGSKWYYCDANGYMVTNKWMKDSKGWVKLGSNGAMLTNQWTTDSNGWCYVGANGYAVTNCWKKDSKGWIYLNANGSMTKSKWVKDGGKWYYCDANGYMVAGKTIKIGGKKYKFNASGVWVS